MKDYYLGVDVGGTKIAICGSNLLNQKDSVVRFPSKYGYSREDFLTNLFDSIDQYIKEKENGILPASIGFGLKDAVDERKGIWLKYPSGNEMVEIPLAHLVWERYGIPAKLDNDVNAATIAEQNFGAGKEYTDFLFINIGTGISIGMVSDGRLIRGASNYAGEAGHLSVEPDGEVCSFCGQRGCFEIVASGEAIIHHAMDIVHSNKPSILKEYYLKKGHLNSRDVFNASDCGDKEATIISARVLKAIVTASCGLINIFNPEAVIYGGGVMTDGWLFSRIVNIIPEQIIPTTRLALREIALSRLGTDVVGLLGALTLAENAKK